MPDIVQIASAIGTATIIAIIFVLAVYGFIQWLSKKKYDIAYVDKYKQLVQVSKINCPSEIFEKELIKCPDKKFSGIVLGYIYGKNFIKVKDKWYYMFVIALKKKRIYNPFTWGTPDLLAIASKNKISIGDNYMVKWAVGGLDYEGFYIFEADGDLTPIDILTKTANEVGIKQANIMLKKMSGLVEEATEANPQLKTNQKSQSELPSKER